jgi:muramidase (phage lysozyme)
MLGQVGIDVGKIHSTSHPDKKQAAQIQRYGDKLTQGRWQALSLLWKDRLTRLISKRLCG